MPGSVSKKLSELLGNGGDDLALVSNEVRWTRTDLADAARSISDVLGDGGVLPGEPVALVARNRPWHLAALAALLAAGRTTVMVHAMQTGPALARDLAALDCAALILDRADLTAEVLAAARDRGIAVVTLDERATNPAGLALHRTPACTVTARPAVAVELLSSGTTGPCKRVPLSWTSVDEAVADAASAYERSYEPGGVALVVHPLANVAGITFVLPALVHGRVIVLMDRFRLDEWLEHVRAFRPRRVSLPPVGIGMILDADIPPDDLAGLEAIGVGGGRLDPAVQTAFEARYGVPILVGYGATEFGGLIANWSIALHREFGATKRGSVGQVRPGVEMRVSDPVTGALLPPGAVGILEARVSRIGGGFVATTDLAFIDEDGFVFLHGRADQAINRGGFKILPETIVRALSEHPSVRDAVAFGVPDRRLGEVPVAVVELRDGHFCEPNQLLEYLRDRLKSVEIPTELLIVDAIPRTASHKPSIPEARKLFEEQPARSDKL